MTATFSGVIVASNFALATFPNVKLWDSLVFVAAFLFGFRVGASVAVVPELVWSVVSPWGIAGYITPFLIGGELTFALAGLAASRAWSGNVRVGSAQSLFVGATIAICAFLWDLETNVGTAIIAFWPSVTLQKVLLTELSGVPFMLFHELSDFLLGAFFVPAIIVLIPRLLEGQAKVKL